MNLERLIDRYLEIVESAENQANKRWWQNDQPWRRDFWRGIPARQADGRVPFQVEPMNEFWAALLDYDFVAYYHDPAVHLAQQLATNIYRWEHLRDDRYFEPIAYIWMGVVTDLSFYDLPIRYFANREPWIVLPSRLEDKATLDRMEYPDFFRSGLMPRIHEFYARMLELVAGRLQVIFPAWVRTPFCHAAHLRGMNDLLVDMLEDPEFVHRLMRFTTDARKRWFEEWCKFTGEPLPKAMLYDDEVDVPTLMPRMYREFILPYEIELAEFHGGVVYWHSCGNTTAIMEEIARIPKLELMHVSPSANIEKAVSVFAQTTALDVDLETMKDVWEANEQQMRARIRSIRQQCAGTRYSVRADGFQVMGDVRDDIKQIETWVRVAQEETKR